MLNKDVRGVILGGVLLFLGWFFILGMNIKVVPVTFFGSFLGYALVVFGGVYGMNCAMRYVATKREE